MPASLSNSRILSARMPNPKEACVIRGQSPSILKFASTPALLMATTWPEESKMGLPLGTTGKIEIVLDDIGVARRRVQFIFKAGTQGH